MYCLRSIAARIRSATRRCCVLFVAIVVAAPPIMLSRSFRLPASYHILAPTIRHAWTVLLPVATALWIYLHGMAMQMRSGELAKSLRLLVAFTGTRLLLMLGQGLADE